MNFCLRLWTLALAATCLLSRPHAAQVGIFEQSQDIGSPAIPGSARLDESAKAYVLTGGGENMWFAKDDLHFLWKKVEGNSFLAADIQFPKSGGNAHRKAVLMFRQSLDPDSPYIDVAVHGDGLTSMQYREAKGGPTREIQVAATAPKGAQLVKSGNRFYLFLDREGKGIQFSGASYRVEWESGYFAGLGVCAHDNKATEEARFTNVELKNLPSTLQHSPAVSSSLEIIPIGSKDRKVLYYTTNHIEAPNWSRDGAFLVYNSRGRLYRFDLKQREPIAINTGFAVRCNNDHGISSDGTQLVSTLR